MPGALHVEQRRRMVGVLEHERGGRVDRHGARAGGRIRGLAGVQCERVEAWVADGHCAGGKSENGSECDDAKSTISVLHSHMCSQANAPL